jgi:ADP-ribose pyrophosphatase YjhB (NUDIX family)
MTYAKDEGRMTREYPEAPLVGVGAVVVDQARVLLIRRGREPLKGQWSLPGGLVELGESLQAATVREVEEETGLVVQTIELIEVLDRIHYEGERVRYHYVLADYLCLVTGGTMRAASDADDVRWAERAEWASEIGQVPPVAPALAPLVLDPVTVRVIEAGWQRAQAIEAEKPR